MENESDVGFLSGASVDDLEGYHVEICIFQRLTDTSGNSHYPTVEYPRLTIIEDMNAKLLKMRWE